MRITSKGQVTIPKDVREKLGVAPGDEVGFREEGQWIIVEKIAPERPANAGELLFRQLLGKGAALRKGKSGMTTDELMELTRGPFNDLDHH